MKTFISEYGMVVAQVVGATFILNVLWQFFDTTFLNIVVHCIEGIIG